MKRTAGGTLCSTEVLQFSMYVVRLRIYKPHFLFASSGEQMRVASQEFADEPCSSMKRGAMVRAARALLSSVTRLLILADMVDVHLLMTSLKLVSS